MYLLRKVNNGAILLKDYDSFSILRDCEKNTMVFKELSELSKAPMLPQLAKLCCIDLVGDTGDYKINLVGIDGTILDIGQGYKAKHLYAFKGYIQSTWRPYIDLSGIYSFLESLNIIRNQSCKEKAYVFNPYPIQTCMLINNESFLCLKPGSLREYSRDVEVIDNIGKILANTGYSMVIRDNILRIIFNREFIDIVFNSNIASTVYDRVNNVLLIEGNGFKLWFNPLNNVVLIKSSSSFSIDTCFLNARLYVLNPYFIHVDNVEHGENVKIKASWFCLENKYSIGIVNPFSKEISIETGKIMVNDESVIGVVIQKKPGLEILHGMLLGLLAQGMVIDGLEDTVIECLGPLIEIYPKVFIGEIKYDKDSIDLVLFNPSNKFKTIELKTVFKINRCMLYESENPKGVEIKTIKLNRVLLTMSPYKIVRIKLELERVPANLLKYRSILRKKFLGI